jgi:hypothetical protein
MNYKMINTVLRNYQPKRRLEKQGIRNLKFLVDDTIEFSLRECWKSWQEEIQEANQPFQFNNDVSKSGKVVNNWNDILDESDN